MTISLIANTGIQFHKFKFTFDTSARIIPPMGFRERFYPQGMRVFLDYAIYLHEQDSWVSKESMEKLGYIDAKGRVLDNTNFSLLQPLSEETEFFKISSIATILELFEGKWLPLPYFKCNHAHECEFGPTNWARVIMTPVENIDKSEPNHIKSYDIVLAFDTKTSSQPDDIESPNLWSNAIDNLFCLCNDPDMVMSFCDANFECAWVDDHIAGLVHGGKEFIPTEFPSLKYLAQYIYFVQYIANLQQMPVIEVFYNEKPPIEVDLVLDIGNANTCGLLFEIPVNKSFEFTAVKKLRLQDLTHFSKNHDDPFAMNLAFSRCSFGEIGYNQDKFQWPSVLRVGKEAAYLINNAIIDTNKGVEAATYHSSPKRYLWDEARFEMQWEFTHQKNERGPDPVYLRGISEQFHSDGNFTFNVDFGATSNFSRKSLMTFVYLEILTQALCQINSHEFRFTHGRIDRMRKLRRIIVTCPTAMVQKEQIQLRHCAEEAATVLKRFFLGNFTAEVEVASLGNDMEIIPHIKDLAKDTSALSMRRDWSYDEATCCQLVFLYGEIAKRYLNKSDIFFNLYGKVRTDLGGYNKKSVTIGSIDIGGGTTDFMICSYQYDETGISVITPEPLYWESFNLAGDDFLKKVVQEVILEGKVTSENEDGCVGVIENHARKLSIRDISDKMNNFFGTDSNNIDHLHKLMRKNFNTQILVPIANAFLEHARQNKTDAIVGFNDLFNGLKPNPELLEYFHTHFGFSFEDLSWKLSTSRINTIMESTFEPLLKIIATLSYAYGCDFIVLAGKPTSLVRIEELFLKFYPVSPDRIINLNNYRIGRWYPFADDSGYIANPKTIVAVGALISLMGGRRDNLSGFRLNQTQLISKIVSTADYVGIFDPNTKNIDALLFTPDINRNNLNIAGLPIMLGIKRLRPDNYPGRPVYKLDFNMRKIIERINAQFPDMNEPAQYEQAEIYKTNLKNRMPFTIRLQREYRENKERIDIESITDREGNDVSTSLVTLSFQTLLQEGGYWLDTGEFQLSIRE